MELTVYKISGESAGRNVNLDDSIFGIEPNDHAIYLDVKQYTANQRQGTHATLNKALVSGSTRKLKRQKGTGTARAGSIKSPLFRGGGTMFGPEPREYGIKLNKKLKLLARRSALSYKAKTEGIVILEDFSFEEPKTRSFLSMLKNLNLEGQKTLLVVPESDRNIWLASRNLQKSRVIVADNINTYEILNAGKLLIAEGSLEKIGSILKND
ncbi:MAG TPA: 50S ribosomal protein L4 [Bacteroidales bacterium]|nr:50S ribosomal protein L4 [Bacteroidales bacterium]HRZ50212.1 50S ribosomal protein L4 [Bacteroidales bacterium]